MHQKKNKKKKKPNRIDKCAILQFSIVIFLHINYQIMGLKSQSKFLYVRLTNFSEVTKFYEFISPQLWPIIF